MADTLAVLVQGAGWSRRAPPGARCCTRSGSRATISTSRRSASASTWSQVTPCNVHIDDLARHAAAGANAAGGKAVIFNTITVSDAISMGTEGMKYSLVSREVIADSIETVVGAEGLRRLRRHRRMRQEHAGLCDGHGAAQPARRCSSTAAPSCPGRWRDRPVDIVSVFEAVGQHAAGTLSDAELADLEARACPGAGSCGGMYTANTMASAIEALGLSLPNSSAQAAVSTDKRDDCARAGAAVVRLLERGIRPRDILTTQSVRERDHHRHRAGRVDQRRSASAGDGRRRQRQADHRRFHSHRPARAGARRPQTQRAVRDGGAG